VVFLQYAGDPPLTHEEGNEGDVLKVEGDHPYDSWRYRLKSMLSPSHKPLNFVFKIGFRKLRREAHTTVENLDPQMVAMASRRAKDWNAKGFSMAVAGGGESGIRSRRVGRLSVIRQR
jgi:hypothetical protein